MKIKLLIYTLFLLSIILNCENKNMGDKKMKSDLINLTILKPELDKLKSKTIYFGHQSVGYNIIEGINDILKENNSTLKILEINNVDDISPFIFAHSWNGENLNPKSKIDSFVNFINNGAGNKLNIAFFKFCYVDIVSSTDIHKLFNYYKDTMIKLTAKYPKVKFIHFTAPLTTYKNLGLIYKIKDIIKKVIGRETGKEKETNDNIKRNEFNDLIRNEFGKSVFDLAQFQSTYLNNERETFQQNSKNYFSLIPEYTDDGGHLNNIGRKIIAYQLLKFLSEIK